MIHATTPEGTRVVLARRADWGAVGPRLGHPVDPAEQDHLVVHHSASWVGDDGRDHRYGIEEACRAMRALQVARPDLGADIPYHWVVWPGSASGLVIVAEGRGQGRTGAHAPGHNRRGVGICVVGNYHAGAGGLASVRDDLVHAVRWIGAEMLSAPRVKPTLDHQGTGRATACAGDAIRARLVEMQPPFGGTEGDDEMTPDERRMLAEVHEALVGQLAVQFPGVHDLGSSIQQTRHLVGLVAADLDELSGSIADRIADEVADSIREIEDSSGAVEVDADAIADAVRRELGEALGR